MGTLVTLGAEEASMPKVWKDGESQPTMGSGGGYDAPPAGSGAEP